MYSAALLDAVLGGHLGITNDLCLYLFRNVGKGVALVLVIVWLKRHTLSSYEKTSSGPQRRWILHHGPFVSR